MTSQLSNYFWAFFKKKEKKMSGGRVCEEVKKNNSLTGHVLPLVRPATT